MTETQPAEQAQPEGQTAQPEGQIAAPPDEPTNAEPMYGAEDVQAALGESGQRALAQSYFTAYTEQTAKIGLTKTEADQMIYAIQNNQAWPPPEQPEINPLEGEQPAPEQGAA